MENHLLPLLLGIGAFIIAVAAFLRILSQREQEQLAKRLEEQQEFLLREQEKMELHAFAGGSAAGAYGNAAKAFCSAAGADCRSSRLNLPKTRLF